jgi:hypothetical protein
LVFHYVRFHTWINLDQRHWSEIIDHTYSVGGWHGTPEALAWLAHQRLGKAHLALPRAEHEGGVSRISASTVALLTS